MALNLHTQWCYFKYCGLPINHKVGSLEISSHNIIIKIIMVNIIYHHQ